MPPTPTPSHIESWLRDLFHGLVDELALETKLSDPAALAEQLALVADGIYGSVQSLGAYWTG